LDLSTHTSGLPRDPVDRDSVDKVYEFLASYKLTRDPGVRFEYSNLGVSLLGMALANRAGTDYPTLLKSRILEPLALTSTAITLSPELRQRFATPHSFTLSPVSEWSVSTVLPAGGIRSTATDLLTFLAAELGYNQTPLNAAMTSMFDVTRPMGHGAQVHLAWLSEPFKNASINWHNGATFGFQSFIGFNPKSHTGVVVLSNTHRSGVEDIGMHLLNPKANLRGAKQLQPPKLPAEISLDEPTLARYAGTYEFVKGDFYKVTPVDGHLKMDGPPDPIDFYFPESKLTFFSKAFDGEITFKLDSNGSPTEFVWRSSTGTSKRYKRVK
jgi:CubicO group peptidase (beta-lactamase class C family)